jgi:glycosyltransferase involved in cell wall biosynthesis
MSNALLEAISFDRPVLASDIAANRELGLNEACYFPVGDSAALRHKISAAIADPAQFRAGVNFLDWDEVARRVVSVYEDLLHPSRRDAASAASGASRGGKLKDSDMRARDKRVRA